MTAAAFLSTPSSESVTQAMFDAQEKASIWVTVYVMGCGVLLAAALLAAAYGMQSGQLWQLSSSNATKVCASACILAVLWMAIGGKLVRHYTRHSQVCMARYEAHVQQKHVVRMAQFAAPNTARTMATAHPAFVPQRVSTVQDLLYACMPVRLPVSIFGAYQATTLGSQSAQKNSC